MRRAGFRLLTAVLWLACLVGLGPILNGCSHEGDVPEVSLQASAKIQTHVQVQDSAKAIKIAVSSMISPKETFLYYQQILDYISQKTSTPVELVQRDSYQEVNDLLEKGELDAAFVCSGAYVKGHDDFGMELLAAPVAFGQTVYYSYFIVPADSPVQSLDELRGKSFAFTDPLSNTGKLAPTYLLSQRGDTPETFFKHITYTYSHDKSIEAVAKKIVDGAAVDSLIWKYLQIQNPKLTDKTRIIDKAGPFGIPPVVVSPQISPRLKARLKTVLLHMQEDPEGKSTLQALNIDRFEEISDNAYQTVRDMQRWVDDN